MSSTGASTPGGGLDLSLLKISRNAAPGVLPPSNMLVFGQTPTDHMLTVEWNLETGFAAPEIKPYGPLSLDPSASVLHYSTTMFEGMKAYKDKNGVARLFRPNKNMERFNDGAVRMGFPTVDGEVLTELIKKLVSIDEHWIPTDPGCSLYIRPTMIGTKAGLGVTASTSALLYVILSPAGPYYASGRKPISLLASTEHTRAFPGGTGNRKFGLNYAGGIVPQAQAAKLGYHQVLWLLGERHMLTEVGMMNLFCTFKRPDGTVELVTPPLLDLILPGVTRDTVLALARAHADPTTTFRIAGFPEKLVVSERELYMSDLVAAAANGTLAEIFGTGTAAILLAVERIGYMNSDIAVPTGDAGMGALATALLREIEGRQIGEIESDWSVVV